MGVTDESKAGSREVCGATAELTELPELAAACSVCDIAAIAKVDTRSTIMTTFEFGSFISLVYLIGCTLFEHEGYKVIPFTLQSNLFHHETAKYGRGISTNMDVERPRRSVHVNFRISAETPCPSVPIP